MDTGNWLNNNNNADLLINKDFKGYSLINSNHQLTLTEIGV